MLVKLISRSLVSRSSDEKGSTTIFNSFIYRRADRYYIYCPRISVDITGLEKKALAGIGSWQIRPWLLFQSTKEREKKKGKIGNTVFTMKWELVWRKLKPVRPKKVRMISFLTISRTFETRSFEEKNIVAFEREKSGHDVKIKTKVSNKECHCYSNSKYY